MKKILMNIINPAVLIGMSFCMLFLTIYASPQSNYEIKVHLKDQIVEIFQNNVLLKALPCSTGIKPGLTPVGKFKTHLRKEKDIWIEEDSTKIYYYYISRFNGHIGFHSMIEGNHTLVEQGKKLFSERKPSSMGCVRLMKEDAKWIYDTIPLNTPVEVLDVSQKN